MPDSPVINLEPLGRSDYEVFFERLDWSDSDLLYAWATDPELTQYMPSMPRPLSWQDHLEWFMCARNDKDRIDYRIMVVQNVIVRRAGRVHASGLGSGDPEVGIMLAARDLWGKGIAARALLGLIKELHRRKIIRCHALIHPNNERSLALFRRCGFDDSGEKGRKGQLLYRREI